MVRTLLSSIAVAAILVAMPACQKSTTTTTMPAKSSVSMGAINDHCPVSGEPVTEGGPTVTYEGHTIGFCCPSCVKGWNGMTKAEKDAFVAKNMK